MSFHTLGVDGKIRYKYFTIQSLASLQPTKGKPAGSMIRIGAVLSPVPRSALFALHTSPSSFRCRQCVLPVHVRCFSTSTWAQVMLRLYLYRIVSYCIVLYCLLNSLAFSCLVSMSSLCPLRDL
eukprot:g26.t1